MARDSGKKPPETASNEPQNLEEAIRQRAYELYEERGRGEGQELEDWLRAEEEVTARKVRSIAA